MSPLTLKRSIDRVDIVFTPQVQLRRIVQLVDFAIDARTNEALAPASPA